MVGVSVPLQHVEPQVAVVLASGIHLRLDKLDSLVLSGREHIDMGEDKYRLRRKLRFRGCNREAAVRPSSEPADHQRLQLVAERGRRGARTVRVEGLFLRATANAGRARSWEGAPSRTATAEVKSKRR
jgi:hypothetical protein